MLNMTSLQLLIEMPFYIISSPRFCPACFPRQFSVIIVVYFSDLLEYGSNCGSGHVGTVYCNKLYFCSSELDL